MALPTTMARRRQLILTAIVSGVVILGAFVFVALGLVCLGTSPTDNICKGISDKGSKTLLGLGMTMLVLVAGVNIVLAACCFEVCDNNPCCPVRKYILDVEEDDRSDSSN